MVEETAGQEFLLTTIIYIEYLTVQKVVACLASCGVAEKTFHHQVMPDDIDIQDPKYHMSRRTFL